MESLRYIIYTGMPIAGMLLFLVCVSNEFRRSLIYFESRQAMLRHEQLRTQRIAEELERRKSSQSEVERLLHNLALERQGLTPDPPPE